MRKFPRYSQAWPIGRGERKRRCRVHAKRRGHCQTKQQIRSAAAPTAAAASQLDRGGRKLSATVDSRREHEAFDAHIQPAGSQPATAALVSLIR